MSHKINFKKWNISRNEWRQHITSQVIEQSKTNVKKTVYSNQHLHQETGNSENKQSNNAALEK